MFSRVWNNKVFGRILWIVVAVFSLPAFVYAASYVLLSGEFMGLGDGNGRISFIENGSVDNITVHDANLGVNVITAGERIHLGDGNLLIEGGGETAVKIKRDIIIANGYSGDSPFPMFQIGRVITAGDGDPELRFLYSDDITPERAVFELDRKGIVASVKTDRGSHFEGFITLTDTQPVFRLNSYPAMRLEMGSGSSTPVDVAIQRETTNTLSFLANEVEEVRVNPNGLEISDGCIKLDTNTGVPPANDCDSADEVGRMKVDTSNPFLYVCTASGWKKTILGTVDQYLPVVQTP